MEVVALAAHDTLEWPRIARLLTDRREDGVVCSPAGDEGWWHRQRHLQVRYSNLGAWSTETALERTVDHIRGGFHGCFQNFGQIP